MLFLPSLFTFLVTRFTAFRNFVFILYAVALYGVDKVNSAVGLVVCQDMSEFGVVKRMNSFRRGIVFPYGKCPSEGFRRTHGTVPTVLSIRFSAARTQENRTPYVDIIVRKYTVVDTRPDSYHRRVFLSLFYGLSRVRILARSPGDYGTYGTHLA